MGRELRRQVPRRSLGDWSAPAGRPDPVQLIIESHKGRLDWLIPVRVGRMAATPYGFLRGAAVVMARGRGPAAVHRHHPCDLRRRTLDAGTPYFQDTPF